MPKVDKLIQRRFQELIQKAQSVRDTYHSPVSGQNTFPKSGPNTYYHMDPALFEEWATSAMGLLSRIFTEESAYYQNFQRHYSTNNGFYLSTTFENCLGVFQAAKEDYESGYLFNVITLAKADTMTDLLTEANILKNANQVDFACIAAGIALELAIKEICKRENCSIGKFNSMNEALRQKGLYNQAMWEQLKTWYTRRNEPAHGNLNQSTPKDADDMIKGIKRFIAEYL